MTYKKILASLGLIVILAACNNQEINSKQNVANEEEISAALDENTTIEANGESKENKTAEDTKESNEKIDHDKWRKMLVKFGEFSEDFADELTDDQIDEYVAKAKELSKETGYWDVKDFVFQEISKDYPEEESKFPLESVAAKYDQVASKEGELTDKFNYERRLLGDYGYLADGVWTIDDYFIQEALNIAYMEDEELYYEDYVKRAGEILFDDDSESDTDKEADQTEEESASTSKEATSTSQDQSSPSEKAESKKPSMRRFGSSQTDYDALKAALVQYYEFNPATVNQITNEDIDIAYTRAMDRLDQTGFGDIGLIFEELGKMYPGASTMYPGE